MLPALVELPSDFDMLPALLEPAAVLVELPMEPADLVELPLAEFDRKKSRSDSLSFSSGTVTTFPLSERFSLTLLSFCSTKVPATENFPFWLVHVRS